MNYVSVSPHFPPNYYPFCVRLNGLGVNVLGLADDSYESLRPELRHALREYYKVTSMANYDELVRAVGYFIHHYGKIDRLESHNEYWMESDARLRTDFNIHGLQNDGLARVRRKSEMKKIFNKAGVPTAPGMLIEDITQACACAAEVGYPIIIKPDIGVGADKTYKIEREADLKAYLEKNPTSVFFLEKFIEGIIITFDGLTDQNGRIVFSSSAQYSEGVMESVVYDHDVFFYTLRGIAADIEELGYKIVDTFSVCERFFHFEFFRTPDDGLLALEINLRPPGGTILDMMNFANDIDLFTEYANVLVQNRFIAEYSYPYHVAHIGRKFNKRYLHRHEEILARFGKMVVQHGFLPDVFAPVMGNYFYLVRAPGLDDIYDMEDYIRAKD